MADPNDPIQNSDDPAGQPPENDPGNDSGPAGDSSSQTTDFVEFEGVKVPLVAFEKVARERYKEQFSDHENKSKWQAENTRQAQETAQFKRDAEAYHSLQSDPRFKEFQRPNTPPNGKEDYVSRKTKQFPEVDPRFFESQYDDIVELARLQARNSVSPLINQQSEEWEKGFLSSHPLIQKQSEKYFALGDKIEAGYDPEDAYQIVYHEEILNKEFEGRLKARDENAKRKLQQSRQSGTEGTPSTQQSKSRSERIWEAMEKHGVGRGD